MIAIYLAQYYMLSCLLNWRYALSSDRTIQVGSNSVAVKPQFDKYVGSIVQAGGELDKEPEEVVLSRAGLQIPQGKYDMFSSRMEGGTGWAPSFSYTNPCGSCAVQRSLGPSQRHRGHNWRPSTMAA